MLSLTRSGVIPDARWQDFLADVRSNQFECVLGMSVGSVDVNSVQRKSIAELIKGKRIAVVTNHRVARGIVTALGWLGLDIKSFGWASLAEAIDHLEMKGVSTPEVVGVVRELLAKSGESLASLQ